MSRELIQEIQSIGEEIKSNIFFNYEWQEPLQAAPSALSYLGELLALSKESQEFHSFSTNQGGSRLMQFLVPYATSIACLNTGTECFRQGMMVADISLNETKNGLHDCERIIEILSEGSAPADMLYTSMLGLRHHIADSVEKYDNFSKMLGTWLGSINEIHEAILQKLEPDIKEQAEHLLQTVVGLKTAVNNLMGFFEAFNKFLQIFQQHLNDSIVEFKSVIESVGSKRDCTTGDLLRLDLNKRVILKGVLRIRTYIYVISRASALFSRIFSSDVLPGLNLLEQLAMTMDRSVQRNLERLKEFCTRASEQVGQLAIESKDDLTQEIPERIERYTRYLPKGDRK